MAYVPDECRGLFSTTASTALFALVACYLTSDVKGVDVKGVGGSNVVNGGSDWVNGPPVGASDGVGVSPGRVLTSKDKIEMCTAISAYLRQEAFQQSTHPESQYARAPEIHERASSTGSNPGYESSTSGVQLQTFTLPVQYIAAPFAQRSSEIPNQDNMNCVLFVGRLLGT